ncbi:hypothetical protein KQX54_019582 [Cotesia glomerata]|uniref:CRAL-TRIO domain-containing protein n=1 Tax=Cotesia glomerata TaxID=32391 RepID=A0AAV7HZC7_COTGL|nr:hypothetical protein KQX54_019582 [Cotesia glomerata]
MDDEIDYKCSLSEDTQAIALEELREDDNIRNQALKQFRAWILKHPSIKSRADPYRFGSKEIIRVNSILGELLMDIEENQVRGYTYVHIITGATIAHGTIWSMSDMRNSFKWMQNVSPIRNKQIQIVSVPNHVRKVLDFIISFVNEKLRNRIKIYENIEDFKQNIDPKILPKELGGDVSTADMIAIFKKKLRKKREALLALDEMYIEVSVESRCSLSSDGFGGISGSFRKLEVD